MLTECMQQSAQPLGTARYACRSRHIHDNLDRLGFCNLDAKDTSLSPQSLARALKPKAGTIVVVHVRCCELTSNPPDQTARWTGFYGSNDNPEPGNDEPRNVCDCLFPTSFSARRQRSRWAPVGTSSILDPYKVIEHIDMLSMGIKSHPYTVIPTLLCSDFGAVGHLLSQNDVIMLWLRLTVTSNCFPHPY
jgi:hypothetical protein